MAGGAVLAVIGVAVIGFWLRFPSSEPVIINDTPVPPVPTLNADQVAEGERLYAQYCAQCHGANLEGTPNWRGRLPDGSLPRRLWQCLTLSRASGARTSESFNGGRRRPVQRGDFRARTIMHTDLGEYADD